MNNKRKSVIIAFAMIVVLSGLTILELALAFTMFSIFALSTIETIRHMSELKEPSDIIWENDIF